MRLKTELERKEFAARTFLKEIGIQVDPDKPLPIKVLRILKFVSTPHLLASLVWEKKQSGYTIKQLERKYRLTRQEVRTILQRCRRTQNNMNNL